jgi:hypothetical protein
MRSLFQVPTVAGMAALVEELRSGSGTTTGDAGATAGTTGPTITRLPRTERA